MKAILSAIVLLFTISQFCGACTMYKTTMHGKTIVGNNEDWITPNTQIWFENQDANSYSVMYVGFMDIPQGAINEAGLIVDGFATLALPVEHTSGKKKESLDSVLIKVMQSMRSVEEVKAYYEELDLSEMQSYQLVFVDRSGTYLIIEGDEMILGDDPEKTFSNFYYSQTKSIEDVQLPYYQKGINFIDSTNAEVTLDYCSNVMEQMIQADITATQYSTIYDLTEMKVRLYYYHDFEEYIELDLNQEFEKEDYKLKMADLFSDSSKGKQFYLKYNNPEQPYWLIEDALGTVQYTEEQLTNAGLASLIQAIANEWYRSMENPQAAIKVFKYGVDLMPNNTSLYNGLGEIYFEIAAYDAAKNYFERSVFLKPDDEYAKAFLKRISEIDFNK